jgi:hypothetical protein
MELALTIADMGCAGRIQQTDWIHSNASVYPDLDGMGKTLGAKGDAIHAMCSRLLTVLTSALVIQPTGVFVTRVFGVDPVKMLVFATLPTH